MKIEVLADAAAVATRAAALVAEEARAAVAARGRFTLALSRTRRLLPALEQEDVPWAAVHLFQVDERVAPAGDEARNLTLLRDGLAGPARLAQVHPMPVEGPDPTAAAARYAEELRGVAGSPPALDLVHLGLGEDGHTASLLPGDPVPELADADVAVTGEYQGFRRMTLTYPALDRARRVLWIVTGAAKAAAVARLRDGDPTIPAGRVRSDRAVLLVDAAAAGALEPRR